MNRRPLPMWSVLVLALALAVSAPAALAQSKDEAGLERQMTPEEFKAAGLHKLSQEELAALRGWIDRQKAGAAAQAAGATASTARRMRDPSIARATTGGTIGCTAVPTNQPASTTMSTDAAPPASRSRARRPAAVLAAPSRRPRTPNAASPASPATTTRPIRASAWVWV